MTVPSHLSFDTTPATQVEGAYPATVMVDGRQLRLRIKRFDLEEHNAFMRDFSRAGRLRKRDEYFLEKHRQPLFDKLTKEPLRDDQGAVRYEDDETVLARLELEEPEEQRAAREARDMADMIWASEFLRGTLDSYVTVEPNQLIDADGRMVVSGLQLLTLYAARADVLQAVLQQVYFQNCLPEAIKKKLALRSAFSASSDAPTPTTTGDDSAPTATPAEPKAEPESEAATT